VNAVQDSNRFVHNSLFFFPRPQKNGYFTAIRFLNGQAFSSDKIFKFLLTLSEKPSIKHPTLLLSVFSVFWWQ
jgi:hypothetical protein